MKNFYHLCLLAGTCATVICAEAGGTLREAPAGNALCIHLYNSAAVPAYHIERAKVAVSHAFAVAGIGTMWENPASDSAEAHLLDLNISAAAKFRSGDRPCLVVKVVSAVPAGAYRNALGFALPGSRSGIQVEAIYHRIELQAQDAGVDTDVVLAYVMAHEIGHVLLGSLNHSSAGIMHATAGAEAWRVAALGTMEFLPEEKARMREGLSWAAKPVSREP